MRKKDEKRSDAVKERHAGLVAIKAFASDIGVENEYKHIS